MLSEKKFLPKVKTIPQLKKFLSPAIFMLLLLSCETHRFDADKRQIEAKDQILDMLHKVTGYDIDHFKEDTVETPDNPDFKKQIQYTLDFEYVDSNKVLQKKKGIVMFTPDGQSIISSKITDL